VKQRTLFTILFALFCIGIFSGLNAQEKKFTVSGYVIEENTGESAIGANVLVAERPGVGSSTNSYGFFSITLPEGQYELIFSYIGFEEKRLSIDLSEDKWFEVELVSGVYVEEVVVSAEEDDQNISSPAMGVIKLDMDQISKLPILFGELDILKTIQLLPGVLSAGEGFSGFHVRGGGADQNLVILDEATVYNSGHLLGFISIFNSDAIKNTTLIKGGMPPQYGGRISSVLDIQMRDGNYKKYQIEGGIGVISSRLTAQGPIVEDKSSFLISGRRTYLFDLAQPFLEGGTFEGTNYYFYDFNAKVNYRLSDKNRLFLSSYFGRDVLNFATRTRGFSFNMPYGNSTATLRWNRTIGNKMFKNTSLIYNDYSFDFRGSQEEFNFGLSSGIRDYTLKTDFDFFPGNNHHIKWGVSLTHHKLSPNQASGSTGETVFEPNQKPEYGLQGGIYIQDEWKISERINVLGGLRYSFFNHLGPYPATEDETSKDKGESVHWYDGFEPRASINYRLDRQSSVKLGYARTYQYLHLVSSTSTTLPTDIWVPSTPLTRPQRGDQYSIGYFRNFLDHQYEASVEVYYRDVANQIEYTENYTPSVASRLEDEFVFGTGRAYGVEWFLNKKKGSFTGWIAYTFSIAERKFDDINKGRYFPAPYDRRHDLALVGIYEINDKFDLGATFVFGSGQNYTPIEGLYLVNGFPAEIYGDRNSAQLPAYHRLDLSLTYRPTGKNSEGKFSNYWVFSIYNVYNRQNPLFIYPAFDQDNSTGSIQSKAYQVSLFPILPSVSWNFKFNY